METIKRTLGGDRLGTEGKMEVEMRKYTRSNHDLSYPFRTSMSAGTLVPFMKQLAMPGDTWDLELQMEVLTHPTIGPLFGSYKCECDIFLVPIRLYQADLHNNTLGIGLNMQNVKLPLMQVDQFWDAENTIYTEDLNNAFQPINPSCILHYLGIKGIGRAIGVGNTETYRLVNAIPLLAYYDIFKQYYSNKQEEHAFQIHNTGPYIMSDVQQETSDGGGTTFHLVLYPASTAAGHLLLTDQIVYTVTGDVTEEKINQIRQGFITIGDPANTSTQVQVKIEDVFATIKQTALHDVTVQDIKPFWAPYTAYLVYNYKIAFTPGTQLTPFELTDIDAMRVNILQNAGNPTAFQLAEVANPYCNYNVKPNGSTNYASYYSQEGLLIKTYLSDLLNNWIETTIYDSITASTMVDTTGNVFSIDSFRLANKINQMLQRIAVSGGTYADWLATVYTAEQIGLPEMPVYMGSLLKELNFAQIVSTAATQIEQGGTQQPLGTLAGKGFTPKESHRGGKIVCKVNEPSYIIGICHITPRLDYSQGNDFDIDLTSMDDLHKPALDDIGFQELITERMAWFGSEVNNTGVVTQYSAGYQPAWIDYMTNIPQVHGNFAIPQNEMFMTLNRRYQQDDFAPAGLGIKDITTYIDPAKFNFIFAQTDESSQNFWMNIGINAFVRRKMSAKIMPNL